MCVCVRVCDSGGEGVKQGGEGVGGHKDCEEQEGLLPAGARREEPARDAEQQRS